VPADPEPAAGLLGGFSYSAQACSFAPGDLFLAYTDGVLEASDRGGTIFGEDRMRELLTASRGLSGAEVSDRLLHAVQGHSGRNVFEDDVCLVAIEAK
jgi:serine phosphatase RsbU (regulator of sigma subunit)